MVYFLAAPIVVVMVVGQTLYWTLRDDSFISLRSKVINI